jgi:branched-chain amino acid aminotransferase
VDEQATARASRTDASPELHVYINGEMVPASQATMPVYSWGFIYGDGVFEGLPVVDGRCFRLHDHIDRLLASARYVMIPSPSHEEWVDAVMMTAQASKLRDGYMRPILSRGVGMMGTRHMDSLGRPDAVVIPQRESVRGADEVAQMQVSARILTIRRTPPQCLESRAKLCNYQNNIMAVLEQRRLGADVGIMLDIAGFIAETAAANLFAVHGDRISTPRRHNVLNGITRATVMDIVAREGSAVDERDLTPFDLYSADEVFLTASLDGLTPVTDIDGRSIGSGRMGPVSRHLLETYNAMLGTEGVDLKVAS